MATSAEPKIRIKLAKLGNKKRYRFIGTFTRSGLKYTWHGSMNTGDRYEPTLLLTNVKLYKNKQNVTSHLWFNYTKGFRKIGQLQPSDKVIFNARVSTYYKGYGLIKSMDYSLSFPTKIVRADPHQLRNRHYMPVDDKNALLGYVMKQHRHFYRRTGRPYDKWYVKCYSWWKRHNTF